MSEPSCDDYNPEVKRRAKFIADKISWELRRIAAYRLLDIDPSGDVWSALIEAMSLAIADSLPARTSSIPEPQWGIWPGSAPSEIGVSKKRGDSGVDRLR